jgi:DNA-binding LytR/AlgR family response regulator
VFSDILYVEGLKDYIKIHLASVPRPVITRMSLKSIEEKLSSEKFLRTHKSYIVAIEKITSVKRDFVCIKDAEVPVSETYKDSIVRITGQFKK